MNTKSSGESGYETDFMLTANGSNGEAMKDKGCLIELLKRVPDGTMVFDRPDLELFAR
jgi:hypothetical protein